MPNDDCKDAEDRIKDLEDDFGDIKETLKVTVYRVDLLYKLGFIVAGLLAADLFTRLR